MEIPKYCYYYKKKYLMKEKISTVVNTSRDRIYRSLRRTSSLNDIYVK